METRRESSQARQSLVDMIADAKRKTLSVGFFSSAVYEDGTPVAAAAVKNEFGSPEDHVPPRPFMRPTASKKKQEWSDKMGRLSAAAVRGRLTVQQVFDQLGGIAAGDVARTITEVVSPKLADLTIANRMNRYASNNAHVGSLTKPLIDTGLMLDSVTHEVSGS